MLRLTKEKASRHILVRKQDGLQRTSLTTASSNQSGSETHEIPHNRAKKQSAILLVTRQMCPKFLQKLNDLSAGSSDFEIEAGTDWHKHVLSMSYGENSLVSMDDARTTSRC